MTMNLGIIQQQDQNNVVDLLFLMKTKFKRLFWLISLNFNKMEKSLFVKFSFISLKKDFQSQTELFTCQNIISQ
jgi:hypothetical protein